MTSLPWARASSSGSAAGLPSTCEVRILRCDGDRVSGMLQRMFFPREAPAFELRDGCVCGSPGAAYEIEVTVRQGAASSEGTRVVRASIDGTEINEQLVLRSSGSAKFVGWLEDPTGRKRIHFTFPQRGEAQITVGVFLATEIGSGKDKMSDVSQAPVTATGAGFSGPLVGGARYALGEPIAAASARLRADGPAAAP